MGNDCNELTKHPHKERQKRIQSGCHRDRIEFHRDAVAHAAGIAAQNSSEGIPAAKSAAGWEEDGQLFPLLERGTADRAEAAEG